jgi:superfamily II DNA/RNA helicase
MSTSQSSARPNSRDDAFTTGVFSVGAFSSSIRSADSAAPRTDRPASSRSTDRLNRTTETPSTAGRSARSNDGQRRRQRGSETNGRPAGQSQPRQGAPRQGAPRQGSQGQGAGRQGAARQGGQRQNAPTRQSNRPAVVEAHSNNTAFPVAAQRVAVIPGEPTKTFAELGVPANLLPVLTKLGAVSPFPIQEATLPETLAGRDVLGRGKTGSGKTIAFGAPLVERLMENNGGKDRQMGRKPRALILAPTRELAMQIDRTVQPIARSVGLFTTTIVGGVPQFKQVSALQRGVDIVIATPGRVEDLIEQGRLDLSNVIVTVLDEADHMCDLGVLEPVQRILHETSEGGQKLLFSATLDKGVATLVNEFLVDPAVHEVAGEDQASSTIDHRVLLIEQRDKREIIQQLASGEGKTLIFTRTRAFAEEMSDYLEDAGIPATSLHGDLNQSRRTRNLSLLTSGRVNVLVATDVAARGIHVDDISLVIQADAPEEYKTYLHRSGRTGRAGKVGTVVTLINRNRRRKMDELLGRAEIEATSVYAAPGDAVLDELAAL